MKEGDLLLCTVEKVTNTVTHVRLPNGEEGTIISSEIAPGRIKHMRHYVTPHKKIVCKVLEINNGHIHLSLRRVSSKEKKEVMQEFKQEQSIRAAVSQLLGGEAEGVIGQIEKDFGSMVSFVSKIRSDEGLLEKYVPEGGRSALKKIAEKRKRSHSLRYRIFLKCLEEDGVCRIKKILELKDERIGISYLSAGNFLLNFEVEDFKEGKKEVAGILEEFEKRARENGCEFSSQEEK